LWKSLAGLHKLLETDSNRDMILVVSVTKVKVFDVC
jgi:hypothetical protein